MKAIIYYDQVGLLPDYKADSTFKISSRKSLYKLAKEEKLSLNWLKQSICKIQYPFLIKLFSKLGLEEYYIKLIKSIYKKPTTNIILRGEMLSAFPLGE